MAQELRAKFWKLRLFAALVVAGTIATTFMKIASAQIVPDSTLGNESSKVTPNSNVRGLPGTLIDGGATRGVNLFHSFSQFNVGDTQRAYFANPTGIQNILTRVTGNNPSNIFGTLGVDGNANLFFLNPNGIVFGQNARLDVAGSFLATTANSFVFDNGLQFGATNPEAAPLLTMNVRPGLQFGANSGNISNAGNLSVGQDFTLAGTNLELEGQLRAGRDLTLQALDTVKVRDSAANPFIASANGKLTVQGNQNVDIFALNNFNSGFFSSGDMVLRSANTIGGDANYSVGGNFRIEKLDGSLGGLFSPYDPVIRANGDVYLDFYQGASLHILAGGKVEIPGYIWIQGLGTSTNSLAETITLSNGTNASINGSAEPTLDIRAGTTAFGTSFFDTGTPTSADIKLGTIFFADSSFTTQLAGKVLLTNQYQPNSSLSGNIEVSATQGGFLTNRAILNRDFSKGGSVAIDSRGDVKVNGIINTDALSFNGAYFGNGGNVTLLANRDITLSSGSGINSTGLLGGNVTLISGRNISGINNFIESQSNTTDTRFTGFKGGDINLIAADISLNNTQLKTNTIGQANAGNIIIYGNSVSLENGTQLQTQSIDKGNSGSVGLFAIKGNVSLDNATIASNASDSNASAGNIIINASDNILITKQSNIVSNGKSGRILIGTSNSSLVPVPSSINIENSTLSTTNTGTEYSGDIALNARDKIDLTNSGIFSDGNFGLIYIGKNERYKQTDSPRIVSLNGSYISTKNSSVKDAENNNIDSGNISINAVESIYLTNKSYLETSTFRRGDAGNIKLQAENGDISLTQGSTIFNNVEQGGIGDAGGVDIIAKNLTVTDGSQIQTLVRNGGQGDAGNITVKASGNVSFSGFTNTDLAGKSGFFPSGLSSEVISNDLGYAGDINIQANSIFLSDQARLSTTNTGNGFAGDISIDADKNISITNSRLETQGRFGSILIGTNTFADTISIKNSSLVATNSTDNLAGKINIVANEDININDSFLTAANTGTGFAGDISIDADKNISITNSRLETQGRFGSILIGTNSSTDTISIKNSFLNTANKGIELAGGIALNARDKIDLTNSGIFSDGNFGLIYIGKNERYKQTGSPRIVSLNGSYISTKNSSVKDAENNNIDSGNISINAVESIYLTNKSYLETSTFRRGDAGNIKLQAENGDISLTQGSTIFNNVEQGGIGDAGGVDIIAKNLTVTDGSQIQTLVRNGGQGDAGNITVKASGNVSFSGFTNIDLAGKSDFFPSGLISEVISNDLGYAGDINIQANSIFLSDQARLSTTNTGNGFAGNIVLNARDKISLANSGIFSEGKLGYIYIGKSDTDNPSLFPVPNSINIEKSTLSTTNTGIGFAGDIVLNAEDKISLVNSGIFSDGNFGLIYIGKNDTYNQTDSPKIVSFNGSYISTKNSSVKDAENKQIDSGNISINAVESISLANQSYVETSTYRRGDAGQINLQVDNGSLTLTNGAQLRSNTFGQGNAGNISIEAKKGTVTFDGFAVDDKGVSVLFNGQRIFSAASTSVDIGAEGKGGNIDITANSVSLNNGAVLSTATYGKAKSEQERADAGNITVTVDDTVNLTNGAQLRSESAGEGDAGDINIKAKGAVSFDGAGSIAFSGISRTQDPQNPKNELVGIGKGGNIDIQARSLSVLGGANLSAQTSGRGDAGKILVNTSDFVEISGAAPYPTLPDGRPGGFSSGLFTTTDPKANSQGGEINIQTGTLRLSDGGVLSARTQSTLKGGDITVNANVLSITGGGQILTTAFSGGDAGGIKVKVRDNITISGSDPTFLERKNQLEKAFPNGFAEFTTGKELANFVIDPVSSASGIFANTTSTSTGQGGNIDIDPKLVTIKDGAIIAADSQGQGQAGNITLTSDRLILDNGKITTSTSSTDGGDITLNLLQDLLVLRNGSQISATAGKENAGGNGGNVTINIPQGFIIAPPFENSDITANAFTGKGGNVNITAQGIFGIQSREKETASSDITASSEFGSSGVISLNTPDADPASGLNSLPEDVVDPSKKIDQGCAASDDEKANEFKVTGRGGLPPSPDQPLSDSAVWEDTRVNPRNPEKLQSQTTASTPHLQVDTNKITPATGWVFNEKGEVTLVSSTANVIPEKLGFTPKSCPAR